MNTSQTATRWAWTALGRHTGLQAAHKLTLLAAADLLDRAAERARAAGGDMFHHDVLDVTVTGFDGAALADPVGVTDRTAVLYCRALARAGLLSTHDNRHFTLPTQAWRSATDGLPSAEVTRP